MKNLYISAIIIIGLFMNMLPSAASALDYDDTDFEFEMTFDEEEFNNFDNENPAVTTAVAASTATDVETTVTTADTEVPPTASESVTTTSAEDIQSGPRRQGRYNNSSKHHYFGDSKTDPKAYSFLLALIKIRIK